MIKNPKEITEELMHMFKHGLPMGVSQGFEAIDKHLKLIPGGCTDILGYPFNGKSLLCKEWIINMMQNANWKWLLHMPDDGEDVQVIANLIQIISGKTFQQQYDNRITEKEVHTYSTSLLTGMDFVTCNERIDPLQLFEMSKGYDGLAIDSWNKLKHTKSIKDSDYVGNILTERNRLMRKYNTHCLMVWHPKNPEQSSINRGEVGPPSVYQFHGGAEVNNNAMNIVVVHKPDREDYKSPYEITFNKIKPKQCGIVGKIELYYDWPLQRFYESTDFRRYYATGVAKEETISDPF